MSLLHSPFLVASGHSISSSKTMSGASQLFLSAKFSSLNITTSTITNIPCKTSTIRMGGGPRTYPGGVSKWQWKRMQAKKAKQLLKARLARERQIYEMRKRAELKAAVSELERPWEAVEKAPTLFSVSADEQLRVLADRFQKPGGFDMWSDEDGPELFKLEDGLPSARFFPKGVVHSIKPYGKVENASGGFDESSNSGLDSLSETEWEIRKKRNGQEINSRRSRNGFSKEGNEGYLDRENSDKTSIDGNNPSSMQNKFRRSKNQRKLLGHSEKSNSVEARIYGGNTKSHRQSDNDEVPGRFNAADKFDGSDSLMFELYGKVENASGSFDEFSNSGLDSSSETDWKIRKKRNGQEINSRRSRNGFIREGNEGYLDRENSDKTSVDGNNRNSMQNKFRRNKNQRKLLGQSENSNSVEARIYGGNTNRQRPTDKGEVPGRFNAADKFDDSDSLMFELSLQKDGSYELQ